MDKIIGTLLYAAGMIVLTCIILHEHDALKQQIKEDGELIRSLYYTLDSQEIACDMAIKAAQVSCVD